MNKPSKDITLTEGDAELVISASADGEKAFLKVTFPEPPSEDEVDEAEEASTEDAAVDDTAAGDSVAGDTKTEDVAMGSAETQQPSAKPEQGAGEARKETESSPKVEAAPAQPATVLDYPWLLKTLTAHVPEEFINTGVVKDIAKRLLVRENVEARRFAVGVSPQNGRDGKLVLLVKDFGSPAEFKTDTMGYVDYKNVRLFDNVAPGQAVARVYRPKEGIPGTDVFGGKIEAVDGAAVDVHLKEGLEIQKQFDEPFDLVLATAEGCLYRDGDTLWISDTITIPGDMDAKMGHVEFVGKVHVQGSVYGKFRLAARRGVEVDGDVEGAALISAEGPIHVKGNVFGGGTTKILCTEDFHAHSLILTQIECAGVIETTREIRECTLYCARHIRVREGALSLSEVFCAFGVIAKELGSEAEAELTIHVVPASQTSSRYRELLGREKQHVEALTLLEAHLGPFMKARNRVGNLKAQYREKIEKLFLKYDQLQKSLHNLREKKDDFICNDSNPADARISFVEVCHPGVRIEGGGAEKLVKLRVEGPASFAFESEGERFKQVEFHDFNEQP